MNRGQGHGVFVISQRRVIDSAESQAGNEREQAKEDNQREEGFQGLHGYPLRNYAAAGRAAALPSRRT
jgi:hypothetical protein